MTDTTDSPTPVEDLLARACAYVTHSHAKNTLDAYAADWNHFNAWCDAHKRRALPASPETILCYVGRPGRLLHRFFGPWIAGVMLSSHSGHFPVAPHIMEHETSTDRETLPCMLV